MSVTPVPGINFIFRVNGREIKFVWVADTQMAHFPGYKPFKASTPRIARDKMTRKLKRNSG